MTDTFAIRPAEVRGYDRVWDDEIVITRDIAAGPTTRWRPSSGRTPESPMLTPRSTRITTC